MHVLGTCGHVDHGKSTFLRCLTGMEPDRLPEEKKRGMTIDLNFVSMVTSKGERVGIVDVPGHQRFVKNMIAGTMMIDGFIFVLAADDGWMPQSEEHLEVLRGLGIRRGIGLLTKIDLVDEARVKEVEAVFEAKLEAALGRTIPMFPFSAVQPRTVDRIREALERLVAELPKPQAQKGGRLWVDRVFSPKGMGVLVTGTLREGPFCEGDDLWILPLRKQATIKGLECYREKCQRAEPTSRVAVQLSRVERAELVRGLLLEKTADVPLTKAIDARLELLLPPSSNTVRWSFHIGTLREEALVILSDDGRFGRVKFAEKLPLRSGDAFVLRTPGGERTVGTGTVLDPLPGGRSHHRSLELAESWELGASGLIQYELRSRRFVEVHRLSAQSVFTESELRDALAKLSSVTEFAPGGFAEASDWQKIQSVFQETLLSFHRAHSRGLSEAELFRQSLQKLPGASSFFPEALRVLVKSGLIQKEGGTYLWAAVQAADDAVELSRHEKIQGLLAASSSEPVQIRQLSDELKRTLWAMVRRKEAVALGQEHFVDAASYQSFCDKVKTRLSEKGQATTSELRELLGVSRKYAILLLEQMDRDRLTFLKEGLRRLLKR